MAYDDFFWKLFEKCGSLEAYIGYLDFRHENEKSGRVNNQNGMGT